MMMECYMEIQRAGSGFLIRAINKLGLIFQLGLVIILSVGFAGIAYGLAPLTTNSYYEAFVDDVSAFPFHADASNRLTHQAATAEENLAISQFDDARWHTDTQPAGLNRKLLWLEWYLNSDAGVIEKIRFSFKGYINEDSVFRILVLKADADWTQDDAWVQASISPAITAIYL